MTSALSSAVHKKLVREILSLQRPSQSADPHIKAAYSSKQALVRLDDETQDDYRIEVREEDLLDVRVWLMGPVGTPFEGGFFQMSIDFRNGAYPEQAPTCKLLTKIFHPNVSTRGDICVNTFNAGWSDQKGSASNFKGVDFCARTVLGLLVNPNPDSVLDQPEAGRLMHDSYEEFMRMAKVWTSAYALPRPACWGPAPCTEAAQTRVDQGMRNDQMGTQPGFGSPSGHSFVSPRGGPDRSSTATRQAHVEHFAPERQSQSLGDSALFLAAEIVGRSDIHDGSDGTLQRQALPGSSRTHVPKRGLLRL